MVPLEQRFWAKVQKTSNTADCWLWLGSRDPKGYGQIQAYRDPVTDKWVRKVATHVAWFVVSGEWPQQWILHKCDNPPCVNPGHLIQGDAFDNMQDMAAKKRDTVSKYGWDYIFGHREYGLSENDKLARIPLNEGTPWLPK